MLTLEIEILYQKWMPKKETINLLHSYKVPISYGRHKHHSRRRLIVSN